MWSSAADGNPAGTRASSIWSVAPARLEGTGAERSGRMGRIKYCGFLQYTEDAITVKDPFEPITDLFRVRKATNRHDPDVRRSPCWRPGQGGQRRAWRFAAMPSLRQTKKSPGQRRTGLAACKHGPHGPAWRTVCLLGGGSVGSGSCSSSGSGIGSGGGSFGSRSCGGCGLSGRSGSCCGSGGRSRCRLFLLATGGQGSSSDEGSDDERLVHFRFSLRTVKKTKNATTSSLLQPGSALAESAPVEHVFNSAKDYIGYSSILNNTKRGVKPCDVAHN